LQQVPAGVVLVVVLELVVAVVDVVVVELVLVVLVAVELVVDGQAGRHVAAHDVGVEHVDAVPGIVMVPGPGRSAVTSTANSKLGGTEKIATSVVAAGPPMMLMAFPPTVMVRLAPPNGPNAPLLRCSQLSKTPEQGGPTARPFSQQRRAGCSKLPDSSRSRQYPEKTRLCELIVAPVSFVAGVPDQVTLPLERLRPIGSVPTMNIGSGGQSWLVGYALLIPVVPGVHAMPLFGPPMHVPLEQRGHGWMPGMVPPGSTATSPVR
jgi:hypothetical protein